MKKMANKMMVAAAMNRRRMESRKVPMYTDPNGNNRRVNTSYDTQEYYPRNTGDMTYYGMHDYPAEMRQRRGSNGRYMMDDYSPDMRMDDGRMMRDTMPMIGFDRDYEHGMERSRMSEKRNSYDGDIYARGSIMMTPYRGMDNAEMERPVDEMTAMKWVKDMQPEDGSEGMKYKPEQAEQIRKQLCPDCDKWEFFVALNMMHADYVQVAKKLGVDNTDFYAHMAKAFLCDKDAGKHKLQKYMHSIPK